MTFWVPWAVDFVVALICVYFFLAGLTDGSVRPFNLGLWLVILFALAGIVGGAIPPLGAGVLVATLGSWAVGAMMAAFVVVSIVSTVLLPETKGTELDAVLSDSAR